MNLNEAEYKKIIDVLCRELIDTRIVLEEARKQLNDRQLINQYYIKKENSDNVYKPTGINPIISESISCFFGGIFK